MPSPQVSQIHIDQALTDFSQAYMNDQDTYVADQIMPMVPVKKRSDKWFVYGKEHFRYRNAKRMPGGIANEFNYSVTTSSYFAEPRAQRHLVLDDDIAMQDSPLDEQADATMLITEALLVERETDTANFITSSSNLTFNSALSGTSKWDDYVNSVPLTNWKTAKSSVRTNAAKRANFILLPYDVALVLADHPAIKDLIKYTDPKALTESGLPPSVRGLRVIEPGAMSDGAVEGRAFSPSPIWGKNAVIGYVNPGPGLRKLSLAYTFMAPDPTTGAVGVYTRRYYDQDRKGEWVEAEMTYSLNMVAAGAGYLYTTVIS